LSARGFLVVAATVGLGALALPGRARAQALQVTPVQVELTQRARNAIVTLENRGPEAMRFQVSAFAWDQGSRGEMQLARTKDVTFFPGLFTIAAGQKRNLRIAAAAPFGEVERTYRIFVEQLPGGPSGPQANVRVLTRVGIPVFLEPPQRTPGAELSPVHLERRKISFVLRNTGNVRVIPDLVRVVGSDAQGAEVFEQKLSGWYVLAGGERIFETEAPRDACARVRRISATVQVEKSALEAQLPTPDGACGP
jgi:fimbrial chaperone protein